MYELPQIKNFWFIIIVILLSFASGFLGGIFAQDYLFNNLNYEGFEIQPTENKVNYYQSQVSQEDLIINIVKSSSEAVVSIVITKDLPVFEEFYVDPFEDFEDFFGLNPFNFKIPQYRQKGTEKKEVGGGTGFIVSENGIILTNAHVVSDNNAEYTVITNKGDKYQAKVLARDILRDIAVVKIDGKTKFPTLKLGDSDSVQIGQSVIAIGNALGEFRNTVSIGVISGLGRQITAQDGRSFVTLEDVIQTDAAINRGNSGGPLLNLKGEVIGVNFAIAQQAENIGFAIPINKAKKSIEQVKTKGKIVYPFLGVRYSLLDEGALIQGGGGEPAIEPNSAAEKVGLKEGDIILEINGEKVNKQHSLSNIIIKYNPGDKVNLKVKRNNTEFNIDVVLGERISE